MTRQNDLMRSIYSKAASLANNDIYSKQGLLITHDEWEDSVFITYNNRRCFESILGKVHLYNPGEWENMLDKFYNEKTS